ncbi:MAG: phosphoribosylamine--glycine ligase [Elusimicrobia bacterium]|nr:phosphoribosylamine--glycine ligase [Elusimicrobiota bacterium]
MKILLIGLGGREHALAWSLSKSSRVKKIFCAPGNAGMSGLVSPVAIPPLDVQGLVRFAQENKVDLTVVGPEAPLAAGLADAMLSQGLHVFGPCRSAAQLESSKVFAKGLMKKYEIPTASFEVFEDPDSAGSYLSHLHPWPEAVVLKADGLAQGKGVVICRTREEALEKIEAMMVDGCYGAAGKRVVVEEFLKGEETTLMAFCDGKTLLPLLPSQDHKRLLEADQGPNTGGMGACAPYGGISFEGMTLIKKDIFGKLLWAMEREGIPYQGLLYIGLMLTENGPKVLEFNVRFGDPETQAVLPLLDTDLAEVLWAASQGRLDDLRLKWKEQFALCVVLVSEGYPGQYPTGRTLMGLEEAASQEGVFIFHAGTDYVKSRWITAGGRVLNIVGLGESLGLARVKAYSAVQKIHFDGCHYRKDIGVRGIQEYAKV